MKKVSGVVITLNEEDNIETALLSLTFCDEVVVVDAFSTDRTEEICRRRGARFVRNRWQGYVQQKNFAVAQALHDWIFSLDADERVSRHLIREIEEWKKVDDDRVAGYYIPRMSWFMGRWIRHTTWYPDYQLRLFRKGSGNWRGGNLHESVNVTGPTAYLKSDLYHSSYKSVAAYLSRLDRYSSLAALDHSQLARFNALRLVVDPPAAFIKNYLLKRGFLDGLPGFVVSVLAATSVFFKHWKLWELSVSKKPTIEDL